MGTGLNLALYDADRVTSLTVLDISSGMLAQVRPSHGPIRLRENRVVAQNRLTMYDAPQQPVSVSNMCCTPGTEES